MCGRHYHKAAELKYHVKSHVGDLSGDPQEKAAFGSYEEFLTWKSAMEKETLSSFIRVRSAKYNTSVYHYFFVQQIWYFFIKKYRPETPKNPGVLQNRTHLSSSDTSKSSHFR